MGTIFWLRVRLDRQLSIYINVSHKKGIFKVQTGSLVDAAVASYEEINTNSRVAPSDHLNP
jgi:hypothetical protein